MTALVPGSHGCKTFATTPSTITGRSWQPMAETVQMMCLVGCGPRRAERRTAHRSAGYAVAGNGRIAAQPRANLS